jgi:hypothetical protein
MFSLGAFRYFIGNPSAWHHYDDDISEEMREAANEIERLRAVLKLVDNYWTSGVREGAQPPWQEVRDALAHEQSQQVNLPNQPLTGADNRSIEEKAVNKP